MANIKNLTESQLKEINDIVLIKGYLSRENSLLLCESYNMSLFTFRKKLKENSIPFNSARVVSILTPYNIKIESNSIKLNDFIGLGVWRREVFKNSNIEVAFKCLECRVDASTRISGILSRKFFAEEPYCSKCITIKVSQHPEYKKNMSASQKICKGTPESRKKNSILMKKRWEDKEERKRLINLMNEATKVKGYKEKMSDARRRNWEDDDYRENMEKERLERWKSDDFRNKVKKSFSLRTPGQNDITLDKKTSYKRKEYIMPSGAIVDVQGYEDKALEVLLSVYNENDIVVGTKNIRLEIGEIFYVDNNKVTRRYFPDIYIKSENKIFEVKSVWTYKKNIDINFLKQKACVDQNINFNFIIFGLKKIKLFKEFLKENIDILPRLKCVGFLSPR